ATLGLAQFSHETTPALAQLFFSTLVFFGLAALRFKAVAASAALLIGLPGLTLTGAPATPLIYGGIVCVAALVPGMTDLQPRQRQLALAVLTAAMAVCLALVLALDLMRWQVAPARLGWGEWRSLGRLFLWFTWPVWPLVLWTLWRWRRQLLSLRMHRHLGLPLLIGSVPLLTTIVTRVGDRGLLLALPALAALAAFALPTFKRGMAALIDWFTLLFFTGCAIGIWLIWVAMETGVPAKPAANVARLAPDFEPVFQWPAFVLALLGTLAWVALVRWRTGRHRTALWKSLVLPAAGATLCWLLLMTLWLPALNHGRSLAPQMQEVRRVIGDTACVQVHGLSSAQVAAVLYHGGWQPVPARGPAHCAWLLTDQDALPSLPATVPMAQWREAARVTRLRGDSETLVVYRRVIQ
ncbi:MAG: hypothetical protein Q4G71_17800, partial [Pseudomonadota bacterium]|nr:hypothetical protein [Pseudomonadota bacterium]